MSKTFWQFIVVLRKDLLLELRGLDGIVALCVMTLVSALGLGMSLSISGFDPLIRMHMLPATFWTLFMIVNVVGSLNHFSRELHNRAFAVSLLSSIRPEILFMSKYFILWGFYVLSGAVLLGFLSVFLTVQLSWLQVFFFAQAIILAAGVSASVVVLLSPICLCSRLGALLLPLLAIPLLMPLILLGTEHGLLILEEVQGGESRYIFSFLAFFCLSFMSGVLLYPAVIKNIR